MDGPGKVPERPCLERGATIERLDVVEYLRGYAREYGGSGGELADVLASSIEKGEHSVLFSGELPKKS